MYCVPLPKCIGLCQDIDNLIINSIGVQNINYKYKHSDNRTFKKVNYDVDKNIIRNVEQEIKNTAIYLWNKLELKYFKIYFQNHD